jgi:hypothetical protein
VFGLAHRDHRVAHIDQLYKSSYAKLQDKTASLEETLEFYNYAFDYIDHEIELLQESLQKTLVRHELLYNDANASLKLDSVRKVDSLNDIRQKLSNEIQKIQKMMDNVDYNLQSASKVALINNTPSVIIDLIDKIPSSQSLSLPKPDQLASDMIPNYESFYFIIENFSQYQNTGKFIYSNPMFASGLVWRLKVYCKGNCPQNADFLSIFLEIISGVYEKSSYQYLVELVSRSKTHGIPGRNFSREFTSAYGIGDCWGYNRFYKTDGLESNGFIDKADQLEIRFSVRALTWAQRCNDLQRYIESHHVEKSAHISDTESTDNNEDVDEFEVAMERLNIDTKSSDHLSVQCMSSLNQLKREMSEFEVFLFYAVFCGHHIR